MIEEKAYAKINLTLDINELRNDNYHEIKTLMVPVDLYDTLQFEKLDQGILLLDDTNILMQENFIYKAAKLFLDTYNIKEGVKIILEKRIPKEAGLGGGSADAAATLRGLNKLFELNKPLDELANLAMSLGSDMPFCVYNSLATCTGRGEEVKLHMFKYTKYPILIIKPPYGLKTKEVYDNYVFKFRKTSIKYNAVIKGLESNDINLINENIYNDLEEAALSLNKDFKDLLESIRKETKCHMSGSGTALFILSEDINYLKEIETKFSRYNKTYLTKLL